MFLFGTSIELICLSLYYLSSADIYKSNTLCFTFSKHRTKNVRMTVALLKKLQKKLHVLRRISSARTKLLATRCECMHEHFPITMLNSKF